MLKRFRSQADLFSGRALANLHNNAGVDGPLDRRASWSVNKSCEIQGNFKVEESGVARPRGLAALIAIHVLSHVRLL